MTGAVADVLGRIEKKHKAALDEMRTEVGRRVKRCQLSTNCRAEQQGAQCSLMICRRG